MKELSWQLVISYKHEPNKFHRSERVTNRSELADFISKIFREYGAFNYEITEFTFCPDGRVYWEDK